mgnify:CR=1 FL=1
MSERTRPGPRIDEELWTAALLSSDTEALIAAARNYLGPVRTPYDKRELVSRLAAFLRRPDSREGAVALLDLLDARIVGSLLVAGPLSEPELRSLFVGELPLFDLGIRVSNLLDRLLLFRFETGGRRYLAVNPILAEELGRAVLDPFLLFGAAAEGASAADGEAAQAAARSAADAGQEAREGLLDAETAAAFFLFLHHDCCLFYLQHHLFYHLFCLHLFCHLFFRWLDHHFFHLQSLDLNLSYPKLHLYISKL